jgi:CRP-like cAMP-binding protein
MHAPSPTAAEMLIRKLQANFDIGDRERDAVLAVPMSIRSYGADQDIAREGDRPSQCCLVLSGALYRYQVLASGRKQIFSLHIAGDIPDLQSLHLDTMDHNLATLQPSTVAFLQHHVVRDLMVQYPRIAAAFWRETLIDAAIGRAWMASIGRRSAIGRVAHLICEIASKAMAVGLTNGQNLDLSFTQEELGDALGLSTVHINRTMQSLRRSRLVATQGRVLTILDWAGLTEVAEFDPAYLHLRAPPATAQ